MEAVIRSIKTPLFQLSTDVYDTEHAAPQRSKRITNVLNTIKQQLETAIQETQKEAK